MDIFGRVIIYTAVCFPGHFIFLQEAAHEKSQKYKEGKVVLERYRPLVWHQVFASLHIFGPSFERARPGSLTNFLLYPCKTGDVLLTNLTSAPSSTSTLVLLLVTAKMRRLVSVCTVSCIGVEVIGNNGYFFSICSVLSRISVDVYISM